MKLEQAQTIALKILTFLVSDSSRAEAFLRVTGMDPEDLRQGAVDNAFLAGIVDYLLTDETLIIAFSEDEKLRPESIIAVRRALPGGEIDF